MGVLNSFGNNPSQQSEDRLSSLCENLEGAAQGQALLAFADYNSTLADMRGRSGGNADKLPPQFTAEQKQYLIQERDGQDAASLEKMMEKFIAANGKQPGVVRVASQVASKLFVMQNLSVGKEAPEIAAADLDGVEFKLSDYRGKIVFLDFWGDW